MLQKQKIDINFLKTIDESVSPAINQTLSKAVNVVADRFGQLTKRWGYKNLGDNNVTFRTLARHDKELIALADEGVYKFVNDKFSNISNALCSEIISEPIMRNVYNQFNPQCALLNNDFITIYEDSRGGYRITVKSIESNSFIVRDVVLSFTGTIPSLFSAGNKVYLFYKTASNTLAYRQLETGTYTLLSEVIVENVTVGDYYKVKYLNDSYMTIGYIEGANLKIGAYKILTGDEASLADACVNKRTVETGASTWFDFRVVQNNESSMNLYYDVVYLTTDKIRFVSFDPVANSLTVDEDIYYYDNMHAITACFLSDRVDIWYDKEASVAQEYLLIQTSVSYAGVVTTPVIRGAGLALASEAFEIEERSFVTCSYASVFQPCFFVINNDGVIAGKFNKNYGMPHKATSVLSNFILREDGVWFPMETRTRLDKEGDYYSQNYGINLFKMSYGYEAVISKELEQYLFLSGSVVRQYDGATVNEAGFLLRPDENMITMIQATSKNVGMLTSGLGAIRVISEGVGGSATINLITGGTYNAETVSVTGTVIDVQIQDGVSTARSIVTAIQTSVPAEALVDVDVVTDSKMFIGSTVTISGGATGSLSAGTYQYQVVYSWTDNLGNVHRSAPNVALSIATLSSDRVQLKLPSLLMTEKDEIWIEIYRTEVDGTVFHLAGYCLNDTSQVYTYYMDSLSDTALVTKEILYTTGGVLESDSYSVCSCLAVLANRLLLANQDSGFVYYTKELKEGFGLGASDFLFINTGTKGGKIVALKAYKDACIVFKERSVGVITGLFATDTGVETSLKYDVVSEEFGCVSKSAICEIDLGIIFQSYQGVCVFNGGVQYIGTPIEDKRQFILKSCSVITDIRTIVFVGEEISYAFNYGKSVWTVFEGHNGFSSVIVDGVYYYLNSFGNIQERDDTAYADGKTRQPIKTVIGTPWIQLGNINGFERFYKLYFGGKIKEPTTFKVSIYYDFNEVPTDVFIYTPEDKKVFGVLDEFGTVFMIDKTVIFESICVYPTIQKCSSFKVEIEEIFPNNVPTAGIVYYGISIEAGGKKGWMKQYNKHAVTS